jgi:hypothetical protein
MTDRFTPALERQIHIRAKEHIFDIASVAGRGRCYEESDQVVTELLLGVR